MTTIEKKERINVFWFRRDLRFDDNKGLYYALKAGLPVLGLFIFDKNILDGLAADDARITFIHGELKKLNILLQSHGSAMHVEYGYPTNVWQKLFKQYDVGSLYMNRDHEPYAKSRDNAVAALARTKGISLETYCDHLIFEGDDVLKDDGNPYTVFTPYKNKWLKKLSGPAPNELPTAFTSFDSGFHLNQFRKVSHKTEIISLEAMGFVPSGQVFPPREIKQTIVTDYDKTRDFPAIAGTSRLGIHFRFGTISIRKKASKALKLNAVYLNELIWRDFYAMILYHFPHTISASFRPEYDRIAWRNDVKEFEAWTLGKTGYPLVDAGMRELNETGYMHNRVRMVVASFLTKHLLIDWRWGEAYFAKKLQDFELASNVGGWQWAAGCGTDAAPYFRIFNPEAQAKKFDPDQIYIKKWVPEFQTSDYALPIIDHKIARERCLNTYKSALSK
ncbi:MAG: deoxyribodipyrimidine photo-lyase [Saprospiraceae bacterium]|nr:deoxyribodipyrimidine photo-lyase [Saprospiraceae bacterium]